MYLGGLLALMCAIGGVAAATFVFAGSGHSEEQAFRMSPMVYTSLLIFSYDSQPQGRTRAMSA